MISRSANKLGAQRGLHSSLRNPDFMSWFKRRQNAKPAEPTKDTKQVIEEIESGENASAASKNKMRLTEDSFIGQELGAINKAERQAAVQHIPFNKWLSSTKVASAKTLDDSLLQAYNSTIGKISISSVEDESLALPFRDLIGKFHFTKALQAATGVLVPDYQLTRLQSPLEFRDFYLKEVVSGKLAKFKESEPNAIDLDDTSYTAKSIQVVKSVTPKDQRRRLSKILLEVESLERENARLALEKARQAA
ncbi:LANO_0D05512g1_1 [Lachancea nothofagi CBS 11611]|uniref:Large ribosomal subunit protein mL50 n=1 Tax=Lachancea nothofagi CBS 11611 TaxID=1266666 RepID=A0A1G4JGT8_9SACH|nr:LANO_0D05512g1_1 [Lachancea nothofagi CBS 11611]